MTQPTRLDPATHTWLCSPASTKVIDALCAARADSVRFVGGCVRNALMGQPIRDIDFATQLDPQAVIDALHAADIRTIDNAMEHGTIRALIMGNTFEITSLRRDVETDGRHAKVTFTENWEEDSERRDFTFNAIYCTPDGTLYDPQNGIKDALAGHVAFIGAPEERIKEDYLRILRFFRFFAWYGKARPDRESLKACARLKDGMSALSSERIWAELKKLLAAPDPSKALRWMRTAEVLQIILPQSIHVDRACTLIAYERKNAIKVDPFLRFMALIDERKWRKIAQNLKLSNTEKARLKAFFDAGPVDPQEDYMDVSRRFYRKVVAGFVDAAKIAIAGYDGNDHRDLEDLIAFAQEWERPVFPVKAADLMAQGHSEGRELGDLLWALEDEWIQSGFALSTSELVAKIGNLGTGGKSGGQG